MAKRRGSYKRAIQIRWKRFLWRFERERRHRQKEQSKATKAIEAAGLIGTALICSG